MPKKHSESSIQRDVVNYAIEHGWLYECYQDIRKGLPDRIFMKGGVVFFIEFKQKGKKPRDAQVVQANLIRHQGGLEVFVVDNVDEGKRIIDEQNEKAKYNDG